jgi:hypothetical protein
VRSNQLIKFRGAVYRKSETFSALEAKLIKRMGEFCKLYELRHAAYPPEYRLFCQDIDEKDRPIVVWYESNYQGKVDLDTSPTIYAVGRAGTGLLSIEEALEHEGYTITQIRPVPTGSLPLTEADK